MTEKLVMKMGYRPVWQLRSSTEAFDIVAILAFLNDVRR